MISSIVLKTSTYIKYNHPCVLILEIPWDKGLVFRRGKKSISWNTIEKYQGYITWGRDHYRVVPSMRQDLSFHTCSV